MLLRPSPFCIQAIKQFFYSSPPPIPNFFSTPHPLNKKKTCVRVWTKTKRLFHRGWLIFSKTFIQECLILQTKYPKLIVPYRHLKIKTQYGGYVFHNQWRCHTLPISEPRNSFYFVWSEGLVLLQIPSFPKVTIIIFFNKGNNLLKL